MPRATVVMFVVYGFSLLTLYYAWATMGWTGHQSLVATNNGNDVIGDERWLDGRMTMMIK
jgi:hypothetical protein